MANVIAKNRQGYGYNYADLGSVITYVTETLGYEIQQDTIYKEMPQLPQCYGYCVTRCRRKGSNEWGDWLAATPILVEPVDPQAKRKPTVSQQYGSALTYARRYSLLTAFALATEDDDGRLSGYQRGGGALSDPNRRKVAELLALGNVPPGGESKAIGDRIRMPVNYAHLTDWQAELFIRTFEKPQQPQAEGGKTE